MNAYKHVGKERWATRKTIQALVLLSVFPVSSNQSTNWEAIWVEQVTELQKLREFWTIIFCIVDILFLCVESYFQIEVYIWFPMKYGSTSNCCQHNFFIFAFWAAQNMRNLSDVLLSLFAFQICLTPCGLSCCVSFCPHGPQHSRSGCQSVLLIFKGFRAWNRYSEHGPDFHSLISPSHFPPSL